MESLPRHKNFKVYYDNWFSSPFLAHTLLKSGFHSVSTLRINRAKGLEFPTDDKVFLKKPRGFYETMVNQNKNLMILRWNDNKAVTLMSSFVGVEPINICSRFDKKEKCRIDVCCPAIVKEYNKFMGGVDLCDMFMALYRIDKRSKKYYLRIVYYFLSVCCCNAWIIHKTNAKLLGNRPLSLREFNTSLSISLMKGGKPDRGNKSLRIYNNKISSEDIKYDMVDHKLEFYEREDGKDGRKCCKVCKKKTLTFCSKCNAPLCVQVRNCFSKYHKR